MAELVRHIVWVDETIGSTPVYLTDSPLFDIDFILSTLSNSKRNKIIIGYLSSIG